MALANHRQAIRTEIVKTAKEFRRIQIEAVEQLLVERGVDTSLTPAAAVVTITGALSRAMAQDCALGVDEGYDQAVAVVERGLEWLGKQE
ncbi:MAG: hypothetical protein OXC05_01125 [Halieaceae bacterium]|nr:hypothetical protein [Halieaceae bacterium]